MTKAPRAILLGEKPADDMAADVGIVRTGDVAILPESEPVDAVEPTTPAPAKRRFSWGSLFVGGLSGFLALAAGVSYVPERLLTERSISVNTAAAGGNASLMTIG